MKKTTALTVLLLLTAACLYAQPGKPTPQPSGAPQPTPEQLRAVKPEKIAVPAAPDPFGVPAPANWQPAGVFARRPAGAPQVRTILGEHLLPIFFEGKTAASDGASDARAAAGRAPAYLASLMPPGLTDPTAEFAVQEVQTDEQGNFHVRLRQVWQGIPVYGGELIAHTEGGAFARLNGRYYPTPSLPNPAPALDAGAAGEVVKKQLGRYKTHWTAAEVQLLGHAPFRAELTVYHPKRNPAAERLAWQVQAHADLLHRDIYFVDAHSGEILQHIDHTCTLGPPPANGPVTANGLDLLNQSRTFGAWDFNGTIYLEDAAQPMFNASASNMPGEPVGAIVTLDALNTSPGNSNFDYALITSGSTTFNNKKAVSAHWNAIKSYQYYKNTFNRNSIDNVGGNIISFINVADEDGSSLGNAFWNGSFMWYGNGDSFFKELARGLDVGGHEMTHGVIEKTANLEYQDESGALNESFADIFGAMIDRDDWKIGEDVVQNGVSPNGCLRSLQDPHNNAPSTSPFWQPKHVDEQYTGPLDNGGVHINSGIPNHAYYLFATNAAVGKDKAEQVFYKALRDYLVKSSQFVDCRLAVLQAANELYGSAVANAAAAAFDAVGIVGNQPGGNYLGQLAVNPGQDFVLCVTDDDQKLDLARGNGTVLGTLYNQGIQGRPSVTDNGQEIVFVNANGQIIDQVMNYSTNPIQFSTFLLSSQTFWRSAAISRDGRFVAATTNQYDNVVYIADFAQANPFFTPFELYNPTYTTGQISGDVRYADILEFDFSGEYLMYDAYNEISNNTGQSIHYWDVGFLKFLENNTLAPNNVFISKLFSGLPENTSIGNPTFAKNSPYVIAFDVFDEYNEVYDVYGANVETGDYGPIVTDIGSLGWPSYNRLDDKLLVTGTSVFGPDLWLQGLAPSKIAAQGQATVFLSNYGKGVWYANGNRSLMVDAPEAGAQTTFRLAVAPNPTEGLTRLTLDFPGAGEAEVRVYDGLGRLARVQAFAVSPGTNVLEMELGDLPTGVYALQVRGVGVSASAQVIR